MTFSDILTQQFANARKRSWLVIQRRGASVARLQIAKEVMARVRQATEGEVTDAADLPQAPA